MRHFFCFFLLFGHLASTNKDEIVSVVFACFSGAALFAPDGKYLYLGGSLLSGKVYSTLFTQKCLEYMKISAEMFHSFSPSGPSFLVYGTKIPLKSHQNTLNMFCISHTSRTSWKKHVWRFCAGFDWPDGIAFNFFSGTDTF